MNLGRATILSGIVTVARIAAGLILNKLYAVLLGPAGLGAVGQFGTFAAIAHGLSTGGLANGVTRHVAASPRNLASILGTAFAVSIAVSLVVSVALFALSGELAHWILGSAEHRMAVVLLGAANLLIAPSALLIAVLSGWKDVRAVTIFGLIGVGLSLCITYALTLFLGLFGALIAQAVAQGILAIVLFAYFLRSGRLQRHDLSLPDAAALRALLHFSLMSVVAALALPLSVMFIRGHIAATLSWADAGYWQGVWRISEVYMLAVTGAFTTYLLPRLAELSRASELRREISRTLRLMVPAVAFMGVTIYAFRHTVIRVLFDETFLRMADLFAFQLIGDVAKIVTWILAYVLIAKALTAAYVLVNAGFAALFAGSAIYCVGRFGLVGATYAYAFTYIVAAVVLTAVVTRYLARMDERSSVDRA
jgi:polysaccharide transporter, PST family